MRFVYIQQANWRVGGSCLDMAYTSRLTAAQQTAMLQACKQQTLKLRHQNLHWLFKAQDVCHGRPLQSLHSWQHQLQQATISLLYFVQSTLTNLKHTKRTQFQLCCNTTNHTPYACYMYSHCLHSISAEYLASGGMKARMTS